VHACAVTVTIARSGVRQLYSLLYLTSRIARHI